MSPPVLGEQAYCRLCSLCSCLVTVVHIGARPRHRHRHLRCRVTAKTPLSHEAEPLIVDALHARCLVLAQSFDQHPEVTPVTTLLVVECDATLLHEREFRQSGGPCGRIVAAALLRERLFR
jgi:hypothetical protein